MTYEAENAALKARVDELTFAVSQILGSAQLGSPARPGEEWPVETYARAVRHICSVAERAIVLTPENYQIWLAEWIDLLKKEGERCDPADGMWREYFEEKLTPWQAFRREFDRPAKLENIPEHEQWWYGRHSRS